MPPSDSFAARGETLPALAVGVGIRPGTSAEQILAVVRATLGPHPIACLATIDRRAEEPGLRSAAAELGVPVRSFTTSELAAVQVPNPSTHTTTALGIPGVAEAAALLAGTHPLLFPKQITGPVVIAAAPAAP
ncbi:cobalamin biosynthesis protein [Nocardia cyriacigeorgica]|uniref:cobalamin biosynthesis protein n=1 Tax=Nocardia cyriacigeorgica TaxID=135487 RepID=UPI00189333DC|nr:cobalamin biosynthesis protein [Nocardia cyriacigeorgica]MBF6436083.1 cobalamin biosynthesis protein [Nocardia cyriacigeorgica]